ncbi:MAG: hypothetical protein ABEH56_05850 [Salinirussus sp.]
MSRYERTYGTDWDGLDREEAIERAYALGVAATLGEEHAEELAAVRATVDTAYDRSVVDLAHQEGKNDSEAVGEDGGDGDADPWDTLIEGETVSIDREDLPTDGRESLPSALERTGLLDRGPVDRTDAVDRPEFLERD